MRSPPKQKRNWLRTHWGEMTGPAGEAAPHRAASHRTTPHPPRRPRAGPGAGPGPGPRPPRRRPAGGGRCHTNAAEGRVLARGGPGREADPGGDDPPPGRRAGGRGGRSRPGGEAGPPSAAPQPPSPARPGRPQGAGPGTAASPSSTGPPPLRPAALPAGPGRAGGFTWRQGARVSDARPPAGLPRSLALRPRSLPRSVLTALPLPKPLAPRAPPLRRRRHCRGRAAPRPRALPRCRRAASSPAALRAAAPPPPGSPRRRQDGRGPTGPGAPSLSDPTPPA